MISSLVLNISASAIFSDEISRAIEDAGALLNCSKIGFASALRIESRLYPEVYPRPVGEYKANGPRGLTSAFQTSANPSLTLTTALSRLATMEVHLRPETESRLQELATKTGRAPNDLIEDAMAVYLQELSQVREMLDGRYDDLKSGRVNAVDGEEAFANLRRKSQSDPRRARP